MEAIDLSGYNAIIDKLAEQLHNGTESPSLSIQNLTHQTFADLNKGAAEGYGTKYSVFGKDAGKDAAVLQMQQNIYRFSHAKTTVELEEFNKVLYDGDQIRPFNDFKTEVEKINAKYNRSYLETEYTTARNAAEHARKWQDYQSDKDLFPNLKYMTVQDDRVRDEHAVLHGVIKPLDDPFWSLYYPPNGWNCRCYTVQSAEPVSKGKFEDKTVPKQFLGNVGKDNIIFSKDQTYFQIAKVLGSAKFAEAFEYSKINAPFIKAYKNTNTGAEVNVSPWTDKRPDEFYDNYNVAVALAKKHNLKVDLVAHLNGRVIVGASNPEYKINGKIGDRKAPLEKKYKNVLRKASGQDCEIVVIDLSKNKDTVENAEAMVNAILKNEKVHVNITDVYIVSADKKTVKHYIRKKQP